jgi:phosphatidylinositol alpha-1,6-mannosyltransferase
MRHLLVTNDFPPKVGGIQTYLWELWRRLPPDRATVLTTPYPGAGQFDAAQPFRVERAAARDKVLLPRPGLAAQIDALAERVGAKLVVLDPALPLGLVGPRLRLPYALVLHGAEVAVPARLPATSALLRHVITKADLLIAAGAYPAAEAARLAGNQHTPPVAHVPPGVDTNRFRPLDADARADARRRHGLPVDAQLVLSVSRLVPRKGMDVLIEAAAQLAPTRPDLLVAIAGAGRDRQRLERLAQRTGAPVRFLGRVPDDDLPALYASADVFAMLCRNRWGGLEQEGFGIVFLEAAACGVPQVAGDSGGAAEAVADGQTGLVVRRPDDPASVTRALAALLDDAGLRHRLGQAARERAVHEFDYDVLARCLDAALAEHGG